MFGEKPQMPNRVIDTWFSNQEENKTNIIEYYILIQGTLTVQDTITTLESKAQIISLYIMIR